MAMVSLGEGLVGHWPFESNCEEQTGSGLVTRNRGVVLQAVGRPGGAGASAHFDGTGAHLEVEDHPLLHVGTGDFSIAAWIRADGPRADVVGDLVSTFDPDTRKGFHLSVVTNGGMTSTAQSNYRNLHFGVDGGSPVGAWVDCGRPGRAVKVGALRVAGGRLYAGTLETGPGEKGHLWRYEGGQQWADLGNPVGCNSVASLAEFEGALYCGMARYMTQGSFLGEPLNTTPGGQVFRVEADGRWVDCGRPGGEDAVPEETPTVGYDSGKADDVIGLTVYQRALYGISNHRHGVFRYAGGQEWRYVGPDTRILSLAVYRGDLYALLNGGPVYRYVGGTDWVDCGCPETSTQTYGAAIYQGRLYVSTWPQGEVYRYEGGDEWSLAPGGRVGYEREIMGMALYNGKVYVGSLPMANVWRMDRDGFTFVGNLDASPVVLRRVWSMAAYQGKLFAGTLPSGHVLAFECGRMATCDESLAAGWHHVAAVKEGGALRAYVDGRALAASSPFWPEGLNLTSGRSLTIGFGMHDYFAGEMSDLRFYRRALSSNEVARLAAAS